MQAEEGKNFNEVAVVLAYELSPFFRPGFVEFILPKAC
jgi:hypothetical protein